MIENLNESYFWNQIKIINEFYYNTLEDPLQKKEYPLYSDEDIVTLFMNFKRGN